MSNLNKLKEVLIERALRNPREVQSFISYDRENLSNGNVDKTVQFEIEFIKYKKRYE